MKWFLVLCLLFSSCATVQDGYEIEVQNRQMVHKAKLAIAPSLWKKVLIVRYIEDEKPKQREFLVFSSMGGQLYAYDEAGSKTIHAPKTEPKQIAEELLDDVVSAYYE